MAYNILPFANRSEQARKGVLAATMLGKQWVVTTGALDAYVRDHKGKQGFASVRHPYHGQHIGGRLNKST